MRSSCFATAPASFGRFLDFDFAKKAFDDSFRSISSLNTSVRADASLLAFTKWVNAASTCIDAAVYCFRTASARDMSSSER